MPPEKRYLQSLICQWLFVNTANLDTISSTGNWDTISFLMTSSGMGRDVMILLAQMGRDSTSVQRSATGCKGPFLGVTVSFMLTYVM